MSAKNRIVPRTLPQHQSDIPTPLDIVEHLKRHVIGQEKAQRALALATYQHLCIAKAARKNKTTKLRKSNVLLVGPTGSGKTLLIQTLAKFLNIPFTVADATEYTATGYHGKDVDEIINNLVKAAGNQAKDAELGIVFIDEIDKIARKSLGDQANASAMRDISGESVQQALLKLLEGHKVTSNVAGSYQNPGIVDTSNILFVCAGAFSDLWNHRSSMKRSVGFGAEEVQAEKKRIDAKALTSYGMLDEFIGRLPVIVELEELQEDDLLRVLTEPENSLVKEYTERFRLHGAQLVMRRPALKEIAKAARQRRVGARGLRSLIEEVLSDALFDVSSSPSKNNKVTVTDVYVRRKLYEIGS